MSLEGYIRLKSGSRKNKGWFKVMVSIKVNIKVKVVSDQVRVTTNFFPKFSPEELLATIGSCIGLWLGLGVVHILEIFVASIGKICSDQMGWK